MDFIILVYVCDTLEMNCLCSFYFKIVSELQVYEKQSKLQDTNDAERHKTV